MRMMNTSKNGKCPSHEDNVGDDDDDQNYDNLMQWWHIAEAARDSGVRVRHADDDTSQIQMNLLP